ncbi:MAG TPA: NAD+ synthase [Terriglobales bacterium]|nr:NAD+ synthase [Terriglobales bacterium]
MKLALAQMNPTVGALEANHDRIVELARQARARGAELVIFPEMAICGYPARDLLEKPEFVSESLDWLRRASRAVPDVLILCGCATPAPASTGKSVHNSALVLKDGEVVFQQSKMLLPTYDVFDELRNFAPAEQQRIWRWQGQRIAITICEDAWNDKNYWPQRNARLLYARDPVEEQLRGGADFLINISASPYSTGKIPLRQEMLGAIAREYKIPVVLVNQVGGDDQLIFDGCSMAVGEDGALRARAACFEEDLLVVDTADWHGDIRPVPGSERSGEPNEISAMHRALVLGTRDYVRKCGFTRVLLGLSGGVDSALTAAIAVEALGPENVTAVYLPSRFSSAESRIDAAEVARRLGIALREVAIEPLFAQAEASLGASLRAAPAASADLAEQNLQSRLRGLVLMAESNLTGALVLSTGNKSELAMGYCTLYGDMAGGLAILADVLKTQVYALARHVNREREIIPAAVLRKAPTAELKPDQRDQDDLPPYEILDAVIQKYIEESRSPEAIASALELDPEQVRALIRRMDHSEYKRQQAAPGLKISKKAFGMGRRLPIAQRYTAPTTPGDRLPALSELSCTS